MSEYTIKTVSGSVVRFDDAGDGLPLTNCEVNIVPKVETGTASGSVVTFSDGADDVPLKSCAVTIAPTLDGVSSVDLVHCGANLWDEQWETGTYDPTTGEPGYSSTRIRSKNDIFVKGVTSIYIVSPENVRCIFMDENKTVIGSPSSVHNGVVTPTTGAVYMRWYTGASYGGTYNNDISFNLDITDTVYHAYHAETHTANLGRTIYGGTADIVNGTGTAYGYVSGTWGTMAGSSLTPPTGYVIKSFNITSDVADYSKRSKSLGNIPLNNVATDASAHYTFQSQGRYIYVCMPENTASETEIKIAYPLETPESFTFDPIPINSRLGYNTMWSNGVLDVTYYKKGYNTKKVNILHYGKNILKISDNNYNNGQRCNYIITENGIEVTATGNYARVGFAISIKKGATYTFSFHGYATSSYRRIYLNSNIDTPWTSPTYNGFQLTDTDTAYSRTFTASTDILFIGFYVTAAETTGTMTVSDIMLEASSSASEYEPYIELDLQSITLNTPIYGGTVNAAHGAGTETYGAITFDGTETWSYGTNESNKARVWIKINDAKAVSTDLVSNGILPDTTKSSYPAVGYGWINANGQLIIGVDETTITSHTAWETYLSSNNLTVAYELTTPIPFTFTPIHLTSHSSNTLWSTEGDITVSYYSYIETDGRYLISGSTLTDIADAIREKTSIVGPINVNDFVVDIMTIDDSAPDAEEVEF